MAYLTDEFMDEYGALALLDDQHRVEEDSALQEAVEAHQDLACPGCDGYGHIAGRLLYGSSAYGPAEYEDIECHECGGSGVKP